MSEKNKKPQRKDREPGRSLRERINEGPLRIVVILISLAALAGAAYYGVHALTSTGSDDADALIARGQRVLFVCKNPECGASGETRVPFYDVQWPQPCPKCGQETAFKAIRCSRCQSIIEETMQPVLRCPKCGHIHDRRGLPMEDPSPPPRRGG